MQEPFHYFVEPSEFVRSTLCYADGVGVSSELLIDRAYFDNLVVMYVEQGVLYHEQCGRKITACQGDYIFADLRLPHKYYFDKNIPSVIYWSHINGHVALEMARCIGAASPLPFCGRSEKIRETLLKCFQLAAGSDVFSMSQKLYQLLLAVLEESRISRAAPGEESQHLTAYQLEEALKKFVYRPADLQKIAESVSMSKYHLCHLSTRLLGVSPMKKLTEEKIRTACRHLQYTNEKVEVIARQLCFASLSYFSKVFKSQTGVPPGEYRRRSREEGSYWV